MRGAELFKKCELYSGHNLKKIALDIEKVRSTKGGNIVAEDFNHFDLLHYCGNGRLLSHVSTISLNKSSKVLDLCSGLGGSSRLISKMTGAHVYAVDFIKEFSDMHTYINQLCNMNTITPINGDACALDLAGLGIEGQIDFCFTIMGFLHITEKDRLFDVVQRAMKPKATIYIEDILARDEKPLTEEQEMIASGMGIRSKLTKENYYELLDKFKFKVLTYERGGSDWAKFVFNRSERVLGDKENWVRVYGLDSWESYKNLATDVAPRLFFELGMTYEQAAKEYPLTAEYYGKSSFQELVERTEHKLDGAYITAVKLD